MVGNMYGEEHPAILMFNGNIITCLSLKMGQPKVPEEEKAQTKKVVRQIIDKNLQIATKAYGEDSIHLLYFLSSTLTNLIALGEIQTPTQANPMIKQMRTIITKFHKGDIRNLSN